MRWEPDLFVSVYVMLVSQFLVQDRLPLARECWVCSNEWGQDTKGGDVCVCSKR